jgi:hypothetical protein
MTRGGSPVWGLGVGLTTLDRKNKLVTKIIKEPQTWMEYGYEIWITECKEFVKGELPDDSFKETSQILVCIS